MASLIELVTLGAVQVAVVRQGEVRVIERRGKFARVAEPGPAVLFSLWGFGETIGKFTISKLVRDEAGHVAVVPRTGVSVIPTRTQVDDYPAESVITRDNATVFIDAVVYYNLFDPEKAVYKVQDYVIALQKLVQSALRDECGKYELDELLVSRDQINSRLRTVLDEATDPWGIKVDRVEIKDIDLGAFGQILAEQRAAETKRRTEVTEAEGRKRAQILRAEGESESRLLTAKSEREAAVYRAEADKQAAILAAQAQAETIRLEREAEAKALLITRQAEAQGLQMLSEVLANTPESSALLQMLELQKAGEVGNSLAQGQATKVFLPADVSSLFGLLRKDS